MELNKTRLIRIAIIAALTLLLLFAAQWVYAKYTVEKSAVGIISHMKYVEGVDVKKERDKIVFFIRLKGVEDLEETYHDIYTALDGRLNQPFAIEFTGEPDLLIKQLYDDEIQFIIFEAMQTGHYTEMREKLNRLEVEKSVEIKVSMDSKNLYLHIAHERNDFFKIIER